MGEKKQIYNQIIETLDRYDVDSYTIFQFGKYYGHTDPIINNLMKYYHIYNFNTQNPTNKHCETIHKFIANFLQKRIGLIKTDGIVYGSIIDDIKRLQNLIDFLNSIYVYAMSNNRREI
jgi:hypothetical protein